MSKKMKFRDAAFTFRMPAGFPGDVNRTHPTSLDTALTDSSKPFASFGLPAVINSTGNYARPFGTGEQSDTVDVAAYGWLVRPYPSQAPAGSSDASQGIGLATPPTKGAQTFMNSGFIIGRLNDITAAVVKGQRVYVWCAATSGVHVQGGLEAVYSSTNTALLSSRITFNGPADSSGNVEIAVNP